jgi:predicted NUDIX family NTP pyrophosphohydrolase
MADVLVHLVDASNPMWRKQKAGAWMVGREGKREDGREGGQKVV